MISRIVRSLSRPLSASEFGMTRRRSYERNKPQSATHALWAHWKQSEVAGLQSFVWAKLQIDDSVEAAGKIPGVGVNSRVQSAAVGVTDWRFINNLNFPLSQNFSSFLEADTCGESQFQLVLVAP